jgi:hypothetical protein
LSDEILFHVTRFDNYGSTTIGCVNWSCVMDTVSTLSPVGGYKLQVVNHLGCVIYREGYPEDHGDELEDNLCWKEYGF